jgi:hypothetical protein
MSEHSSSQASISEALLVQCVINRTETEIAKQTSVFICVHPWTNNRQAELSMRYLFGM